MKAEGSLGPPGMAIVSLGPQSHPMSVGGSVPEDCALEASSVPTVLGKCRSDLRLESLVLGNAQVLLTTVSMLCPPQTHNLWGSELRTETWGSSGSGLPEAGVG